MKCMQTATADRTAMLDLEQTSMERKKALRYANLFWLFMIGNVLGVVIEGVWSVHQNGHWESHVTMIWGPFNIVYGVGAVGMYIAATLLEKRSVVLNFLTLALIGSVVEYIVAVFQERVFNSISWSYYHHPMNLNGKISLPITLIWGTLGVLFAKLIMPLLKKLFPHLDNWGWDTACVILSVFIAVDMLVSLVLLYRWGWGWTGHSSNAVFQAIDSRYSPEFMENRFMEWTLLGGVTY